MEWTCYLCKIQGKTNTEDETKCAYFFFRCEYKSARVRGVLAAASYLRASYLQVPPRACGEEGERMHARDTYCCFARTSCCNCARETGWTEFDKHACQHCKFVNACFDA